MRFSSPFDFEANRVQRKDLQIVTKNDVAVDELSLGEIAEECLEPKATSTPIPDTQKVIPSILALNENHSSLMYLQRISNLHTKELEEYVEKIDRDFKF